MTIYSLEINFWLSKNIILDFKEVFIFFIFVIIVVETISVGNSLIYSLDTVLNSEQRELFILI